MITKFKDINKYDDYQICPNVIAYYNYISPYCFPIADAWDYSPREILRRNYLDKTKHIYKKLEPKYFNNVKYYLWFIYFDDYRAYGINFYYPWKCKNGDKIKVYYETDLPTYYNKIGYINWVDGKKGVVINELVPLCFDWNYYCELNDYFASYYEYEFYINHISETDLPDEIYYNKIELMDEIRNIK